MRLATLLQIVVGSIMIAGCDTDGAQDQDTGYTWLDEDPDERARMNTILDTVDCGGSDGDVCIECGQGGTLACCHWPRSDCLVLPSGSAFIR